MTCMDQLLSDFFKYWYLNNEGAFLIWKQGRPYNVLLVNMTIYGPAVISKKLKKYINLKRNDIHKLQIYVQPFSNFYTYKYIIF